MGDQSIKAAIREVLQAEARASSLDTLLRRLREKGIESDESLVIASLLPLLYEGAVEFTADRKLLLPPAVATA